MFGHSEFAGVSFVYFNFEKLGRAELPRLHQTPLDQSHFETIRWLIWGFVASDLIRFHFIAFVKQGK